MSFEAVQGRELENMNLRFIGKVRYWSQGRDDIRKGI